MTEHIPSQEFWGNAKRFKREPVSEVHHPNVVVASFDVLGFGEILRSSGGTKTAAGILVDFYQNLSVTFGLSKTNPTIEEFGWRQERYSDCVFMYGNPSEPIETQLHNILVLASKTICVGFNAARPYAVRCGIGLGDLLEVTITTFKGDVTYHTGTSVLNAHELEEAQCWAGGAIQSTLRPYLKGTMNAVEYPVPLKASSNWDQHVAVNWVTPLLSYEGPPVSLPHAPNPQAQIEAAFGNTSGNSSADEKRNNTLAFFNAQQGVVRGKRSVEIHPSR